MCNNWLHFRRFIKERRFIAGTGLAIFLSIGHASAGVLVAPTVVFLDEHRRTGRITVQNPSDSPKEISIRMSFGLPTADSLGNVYVRLQDSNITDSKAATDWVKAFPRKMVLQPGGTQVVRFVARPPKDIPDGEYWARVVITSQEGQTTIPSVTDGAQISTRLNMIMQTAIMLKFRKGDMVARLTLNHVKATRDDSLVNVMVDLSSTGNASYVGLLHCRLFDAEHREILYRKHDLAVYRHLRRRISFPVDPITESGPFTVELFITSRGRTDIAAEYMVYGNEIEYSMTIP